MHSRMRINNMNAAAMMGMMGGREGWIVQIRVAAFGFVLIVFTLRVCK